MAPGGIVATGGCQRLGLRACRDQPPPGYPGFTRFVPARAAAGAVRAIPVVVGDAVRFPAGAHGPDGYYLRKK